MGGGDRLFFAPADDAHQIVYAHHLYETWNLRDRTFVDGDHRCTVGRRAHDAAVQHPGDVHVLHIGETAEDFFRNIPARNRFADDPVILGLLRFRLAGDLDVELLAADEVGVGELPGRRIAHADDAVGG